MCNRVKTIYELDNLPDLVRFGELLEQASLQTLQDGVMTKDLVALAEGETRAVTTDEFILEIRQRLEKLLAC